MGRSAAVTAAGGFSGAGAAVTFSSAGGGLGEASVVTVVTAVLSVEDVLPMVFCEARRL